MSNIFKTVRWSVFAFCIVCAICVLGMAAHQASLWLPYEFHKPYIIYALVTSSLTIFVLIMLILRSQPRFDIVITAVLAILWLALAAYSADRVGHINCENLANERKPTKSGGSVNSMVWCRELKAIMAFSWAVWAMLLITLGVLIKLVINASSRGNKKIWSSSVSDLHFGGDDTPPYARHTASQQMVYTTGGTLNSQVVYQQPGHNVVIENGQVRQIPTGSVY